MTNNYNRIAGIYDFLSRIIFQKAIVYAQIFLLKMIPANSDVLIVGGGTGWVLDELAKLNKQNISVTYIEKSSKMIKLAKKRKPSNLIIEFVELAVEDFITQKKYDVVFTAFLFDNFQPEKVQSIFNLLNKILKQNGCWLFADFSIHHQHKKYWQRFLLKTMYLFFKLTCNIETQQLTNVHLLFESVFIKTQEAFFYSGFIEATAYKKLLLE